MAAASPTGARRGGLTGAKMASRFLSRGGGPCERERSRTASPTASSAPSGCAAAGSCSDNAPPGRTGYSRPQRRATMDRTHFLHGRPEEALALVNAMGNVQCCAGGAPRSQLLKANKKSRGRGGRGGHNCSGSSGSIGGSASPAAAKPYERKATLRGSRTMRRCELQSAVESTQNWLEQCLAKVAEIRRASLIGIGPTESAALKELDEDLQSRNESIEQLLLCCHDYLDANNYQDVAFDIDVGTLEKSWRRCQQSVERLLGRRELGIGQGPAPASSASAVSCSSSALSTSTTESDSVSALDPRPSHSCKSTGSDNRAFTHTDGAAGSTNRKYVPHLTWQYRAVIKNVSQRKCKPRSSVGRSSVGRSRSNSHSSLTSGDGSSGKMACGDARHRLAVAAVHAVAESCGTTLVDRHRGDGAEDVESCWARGESAEYELPLMKNRSDGVLSDATSSKMSRSCAFHEDLHAVQSWADGHDTDGSEGDDGYEPVDSYLNADSAAAIRLKRSQGVHEQLSRFADGAGLSVGTARNIEDTQRDAFLENTAGRNLGSPCDHDAATTDRQSPKTDFFPTSGAVTGLKAFGSANTDNFDNYQSDFECIRSSEYQMNDGRPVDAGDGSTGHALEDQSEDLRLHDDHQSQALSDFLLQYNSLLCWLAEVKDCMHSQVTDNVTQHLCYLYYLELSQLSSTERWQRLEQARQSLTSLQPEPLVAVDRRLIRVKVVYEQLTSDLAASTWRSCSFEKMLSDAGHELDILQIRLREAETALSCLPVLFDGSHLYVDGTDRQLPVLKAEQERAERHCRGTGAIAKLGKQLHALLLARRCEHFGSASAAGSTCTADSPSDEAFDSRTQLNELASRAAAVEQEAKRAQERWLTVRRLAQEQQDIAEKQSRRCGTSLQQTCSTEDSYSCEPLRLLSGRSLPSDCASPSMCSKSATSDSDCSDAHADGLLPDSSILIQDSSDVQIDKSSRRAPVTQLLVPGTAPSFREQCRLTLSSQQPMASGECDVRLASGPPIDQLDDWAASSCFSRSTTEPSGTRGLHRPASHSVDRHASAEFCYFKDVEDPTEAAVGASIASRSASLATSVALSTAEGQAKDAARLDGRTVIEAFNGCRSAFPSGTNTELHLGSNDTPTCHGLETAGTSPSTAEVEAGDRHHCHQLRPISVTSDYFSAACGESFCSSLHDEYKSFLSESFSAGGADGPTAAATSSPLLTTPTRCYATAIATPVGPTERPVGPIQQSTAAYVTSAAQLIGNRESMSTMETTDTGSPRECHSMGRTVTGLHSSEAPPTEGPASADDSQNLPSIEQPNGDDMLDAAAGVDGKRDFIKKAVAGTAVGAAVTTANVPQKGSRQATGCFLRRHSYAMDSSSSYCYRNSHSGGPSERTMSNLSTSNAEDSCSRVHAQAAIIPNNDECRAGRQLHACDYCHRKLHSCTSQRSALPDEQKRIAVLTPCSDACPLSAHGSAEVAATPWCTLKAMTIDATRHSTSSQNMLNYETITLSPRSRCFYAAESKAGPDGSTRFSETVCISSTVGLPMSSAADSVNPLHIQAQDSGDCDCRNSQPPSKDTSLPVVAMDATRLRCEQNNPTFNKLPYVECKPTFHSADSLNDSTDAARTPFSTVEEPHAQDNNFEPPRCDTSEERSSCSAAVCSSLPAVLNSDGIQQTRALLLRLQFDPIDCSTPRLSQDSVRSRGQRASRAKSGTERCRSEARLWIPSPRGRCFSAATALGIVSSSNDIRDPFSLACTLSAPDLNDDAGASMLSALSYASYSCESTTSTSRSDFSNCFEDDASITLPSTQSSERTARLSACALPPSSSTLPHTNPDLVSSKERGSTTDLTEMCSIKPINSNGSTCIHTSESAIPATCGQIQSNCTNQDQDAASEGKNSLSLPSDSDCTSCKKEQNEVIYKDQDSGINVQSSAIHCDDSSDYRQSFDMTFETSRHRKVSEELIADGTELLSSQAASDVDVSDNQGSLLQSEDNSHVSLSTKARPMRLIEADVVLDMVDTNFEYRGSADCLDQLESSSLRCSTPNDANEQPSLIRDSPRNVSAPETAMLHVGDPCYSGGVCLGAATDSSDADVDADVLNSISGAYNLPVVARRRMDGSPCVEDYSDVALADSDDSLSVSMQSFGRASVDSSSKLCGSDDSSSCGDVNGDVDFLVEQAASLDCSVSQAVKLYPGGDVGQNVSDGDVDNFTPAAGLSRSVPSIPLMVVNPSSLMDFRSHPTGGASETVHDGRRRCEVAYLPQAWNFRAHSERESSVETLKAAEETEESPSAASVAALRTELLLGRQKKPASSRRRKKNKLRDSRADTAGASAAGLGDETVRCVGGDDLDAPPAASGEAALLASILTTDRGSQTPSDSSLHLSATSGTCDSSDDTDELLQPASFSETAWDSYQERYNTSDLEAEESASAASLAECPQLLCWDDDLSMAAGTEEDVDTLQAGVQQTDPLGGELAGLRQRRAGAADDSDSDLDDLCDVLRQSSHQLAMMERLIKKARGDCQTFCVKEHDLGKYVQWLATCRTNLKWLRAIVKHLMPPVRRPVDNPTSVANERHSLHDLIARWQQLELKASSLQCLAAQLVDTHSVSTQVKLKVEESNQLLAVCSAPSDAASAHNHLIALKVLRKELSDLTVPPGASAVNEYVSRALLAANEQRHQCERRVRSRIRKLHEYLRLWRAFEENRRDLTYLIHCGAAEADDQQQQASPALLGALAVGNRDGGNDVDALQDGGLRLRELFAQADALAAAGSDVVSLHWPLCARQAAEQLAAEFKRQNDHLAVGDVRNAPDCGSNMPNSDFGADTDVDEPDSLLASLEEPVASASLTTTAAVTEAAPMTTTTTTSSCSALARKCWGSRARTAMAITAAVWACALLTLLLAVYLQPACCDYSRVDGGGSGGSWGLSTEFFNGLPPT